MLIGANAPVRQPLEAPASTVDARRTDSGSKASTPAPAKENRSAPYYSPKLRFDNDANVVVLEFRDLNTGKLERTIPTKGQLEAYEKAARIAREKASAEQRALLSGDGQEQGGADGKGSAAASAAKDGPSSAETAASFTPRPTPAAVAAAVPQSSSGGASGLSSATASFRQIDV